jgi:hypothetical protein
MRRDHFRKTSVNNSGRGWPIRNVPAGRLLANQRCLRPEVTLAGNTKCGSRALGDYYISRARAEPAFGRRPSGQFGGCQDKIAAENITTKYNQQYRWQAIGVGYIWTSSCISETLILEHYLKLSMPYGPKWRIYTSSHL